MTSTARGGASDTVDLPGPVLATLFDLCGLGTWQHLTPAEPAELDVLQLRALVGAGVLERPEAAPTAVSESFRRTARLLERPQTRIELRIWTEDEDLTTIVFFPGALADGDGVSVTPAPHGVRIRSGIQPSALLSLIQHAALEPWVHDRGQSFRAWLDPSSARLFFGIIDWLDAGGAADTRQADGTAALQPEPLHAFLRSDTAAHHARCYAPYIRLATGAQPEWTGAVQNAATETLIKAGQLVRSRAGLIPTGALGSLAHPGARVTSALHWRAVDSTRPDEISTSQRVVVGVGREMLLALDQVEGGVIVHAPGARQLREDFIAELSGHRRQPPAAEPAHDRASPTDDSRAPSARHDGPTTAAPVAAEAPAARRFCTACGTALKTTSAFCTGCGRAVD